MAEPATGDASSPEAAGRAEADDFERQLREIEAREREAILAGARSGELVAFRSAVQESLVWRAAQALRRLIGRAW
jgi:hypothetical protein